ncbi:MAG: M23 family metallopeptidase [Deltaproteobacteria bacterium]|nr:M23 family metallopeptidase [Deltaproteobacteria bacterium]
MANKTYTILIVPERSSQVRRLIVPQRSLVQVGLGALALVAVGSFMAVHYLYMVDQASQNRGLKNENVMLKAQVRRVQEEIARIDGTLQRIDQFAAKVRSITQLNDPERNLAMGPLSADSSKPPAVLYAPGERIEYEDELLDSKLAMRLIDSKLDGIESESLKQDSNMRELHEYFAEDTSLLSTTPSVRPTRSKLLTSTFGVRTDPYTNHRVMHKGVDIAADHGADVITPADGVVIFVGSRGGYGKAVVIDHGYGVQTHFAHMSAFRVEIGQKVLRGQVIGGVGNTGRSTGTHLHYEVRFNGIPQNPEKYMLD